MEATLTVHIELDPGEEALPEAQAVQAMQNGIAKLGRLSVDELAAIYRLAVAKGIEQQPKARAKHAHKKRGVMG